MPTTNQLTGPYQLVLIGPQANRCFGPLGAEMRSQFREVGLDPKTDLQLLRRSDLMQADAIRQDHAPVFVWCGGPGPSDPHNQSALVADAIRQGNPVFVIVKDLANPPFWRQVPRILQGFNGTPRDRLPDLVGYLLQAFGLTRRGKRTFISYRRAESRDIAVQLFDVLQHRGHDVFLDTASIAPGRAVQSDLKARLADVDLVILLHTKQAFQSEWVYEEILDAQLRGTEVFDIRWPSVKPMRALSLGESLQLSKTDLVRQRWQPSTAGRGRKTRTHLKQTVVRSLIPRIEAARIRSIRTRRDRIIRQLAEDAELAQMEAAFCPMGTREIPMVPHFVLRHARRKKTRGVAFVSDGTPRSAEIHQHSSVRLPPAKSAAIDATIIYDEFGVLVEDLVHLDWLNAQFRNSKQVRPVRTMRLCDALKWMKQL